MVYRMKVNRYIAGLLLLCFSAFLGHSLVPHHHHSEVFHSPIATDCPFEHGDHQGHEHDSDVNADAHEHPFHCHAFNDVVFEKFNSFVNKPLTSQLLAIAVSQQTLALEEPQILTSSPFIFLKLPCKSHTDLGTRALRAPPSFV